MPHVLFVTVLAAALLAQPIVPVEQEPRHRTVFENAWVRVLDVNFEAGMASQFHRHALNNVAVRIVGGTTRADTLDAEGQARRVTDGSVVFHRASPPYVHRVVNVGSNAVHIVDVELLGVKAVPVTRGPDDLAGHVVEIENEHVRVSRVRLAPGQVPSPHRHPRGWLEVVVTGDKPGRVAWREASPSVGIEPQVSGVEYVEIEPR